MPGAISQGMIWGIMAIGLYITYKVLDYSDLTVDGTMATGGAVCIMLMMNGVNVWLALIVAVIAGMLAGLVTGLFHTAMGIPPILAGILTQLSLYSINLTIMGGKANQAVSVTKYKLIVSSRYSKVFSWQDPALITLFFVLALIGILCFMIFTKPGNTLRSKVSHAIAKIESKGVRILIRVLIPVVAIALVAGLYALVLYLTGLTALEKWTCNPIFMTLIFIVLLIAALYWFFGTELGCALRATGANAAMSRAQGINTNLCKILGLMVANGIVAMSSAMYSHYQGFVDVNMGRGAIVIGLAAVIISDVIFGKLFRNFALKLLAVALGAVIYYMVIQVVLWLGLDTNMLKLLSALIVALFLAIPYWNAQLAARTVKKGGRRNA